MTYIYGQTASPIFNALYAQEPTPEEIAQMALRPDQVMAAEGGWPYQNLSRYGVDASDFATSGVYAMQDPYMRKVDELFGALPEDIASNISVNSGYRTPDYNAGVGGAGGSQHLYGNAVDIGIDRLTPEQRAVLSQTAGDIGFPGVGGYSGKMGHVHLDDGPVRQWGEMHPGIDVAMIQGSGEAAPRPDVDMAPVTALGAAAQQPTPPSAGFMPTQDDRSGGERVFDWMGNEGMLSSLLTGAGLLIGGREALPLLGDFGGQYDAFDGQRRQQQQLNDMVGMLGERLSPEEMTMVQALAAGGQPDKAVEYAISAASAKPAEYAFETMGDGTLVAIDKADPRQQLQIGGPKPRDAKGGSDGLTTKIKEARYIAEQEAAEQGMPLASAETNLFVRRRTAEIMREEAAPKPENPYEIRDIDGVPTYVPTQPGARQAIPIPGVPKPAADVPDPTTDMQNARTIAIQRALRQGLRPGTAEAKRFVDDETARILETTKYVDQTSPDVDAQLAREEKFLARYNKDRIVQAYAEQDAAYAAMETAASLAKDGNTVAAQAAIVSFVKSLDPTSVVRDSETGAIVRSAGLGEAVWSQINYVLGESQVRPEMLQRMVETVRASMSASYPKALDRYHKVSKQAEGYGLDAAGFLIPPRRYPWMAEYQNEALGRDATGADPFGRSLEKLPLSEIDDMARKEAAEALRALGAPQADMIYPSGKLQSGADRAIGAIGGPTWLVEKEKTGPRR